MYALGHRSVLPQGDPKGKVAGLMMAIEMPDDPRSLRDSDWKPEDSPEWERPVRGGIARSNAWTQTTDIPWQDSPDLLTDIQITPLPPLALPEDLRDSTTPEPTVETTASMPADSEEILPKPIDEILPQQVSSEMLTSVSLSPAEKALPSPVEVPANIPRDYQTRRDQNRLEIVRALEQTKIQAAVAAALMAFAFAIRRWWLGFGSIRRRTETRAMSIATARVIGPILSDWAGSTGILVGRSYSSRWAVSADRCPGLSLIREQMPSGDLSGSKQVGNEHSVVNAHVLSRIAMLAMAEARRDQAGSRLSRQLNTRSMQMLGVVVGGIVPANQAT